MICPISAGCIHFRYERLPCTEREHLVFWGIGWNQRSIMPCCLLGGGGGVGFGGRRRDGVEGSQAPGLQGFSAPPPTGAKPKGHSGRNRGAMRLMWGRVTASRKKVGGDPFMALPEQTQQNMTPRETLWNRMESLHEGDRNLVKELEGVFHVRIVASGDFAHFRSIQ